MRPTKRVVLDICFVLLACGALFFIWKVLPSTLKPASPDITSVATPIAPVLPVSAPAASQPALAVADHLPAGLVASPATPSIALDDSDSVFRKALSGLMGERALGQFFLTEQLVRKFVATVDNLPRQAAPMQMMPVKPTPGRFETDHTPNSITIAPANTRRYVGFIDAVSMVNPHSLVGLYAQHYGLFEQAYRELGYPTGYFNDRLLVAIDDLLATEDVAAPVAVIQPKVLYEFADPAVEKRSAGQKIMTRIGNSYAQRLKKLLKSLRTEITRLDTASSQQKVHSP
jgi:hypothetical protein